MLKNKRILLIIILAIALFLIPSICKATTINATQTTTTSTEKTVKWSYELEGDSAVNLICTNKLEVSGTVEIPSTIDGHTVVTIGNTKNSYSKGAFEECYGLQGVTIPSTVTEIGKNAFRSCTGIKSIIIPDTVVSIGDSAFRGCTGLKTIVIPDSVTNLGEYAFSQCSSLTSLNLSKNLTKISREAFSHCSGLTSVIIPDSVTTIDGLGSIYGAFEDCTNLTKVLIPDSVATIVQSAFKGCPNLTIYGNDGQVSKQYAKDNDIKFDYIANWNKGTSGSDIAAPTVTSIYIEYSSIMGYYNSTSNRFEIPKGATIQINIEFSEDIIGKTVPTFKIKCGTGSEISLTSGAVSGKSCVYNYQIKEGDVGLITAVSLEGGDITDAAGNKAELSCPKLIVQYHSDNIAYANSETAVIEKPNNDTQNSTTQNGNQASQTPNNTQNPSNTNSDTNKDTTTKDPTIKNDNKLPQTGIALLSLVAVSLIAVAAISKVKYGKYKDI